MNRFATSNKFIKPRYHVTTYASRFIRNIKEVLVTIIHFLFLIDYCHEIIIYFKGFPLSFIKFYNFITVIVNVCLQFIVGIV